jgi:dTDP-L-rhamnose 4-epimerase
LRQNLPLTIFEDGRESRDFVHVSDVVRALQQSLTLNAPGFATLNIGSGVPTSVLEVAQILKRLWDSESQILVSGDFRVGDIRHCYADIRQAKESLGYVPNVSIDAGLAQFVEWAMTNEPMVDRSGEALNELRTNGLAGRAAP